MKKFTITFTMKNGDRWVTNKNTRKQMSEVIQSVLNDGSVSEGYGNQVVKFSVEERNG
tara:strand:- start:249 stop:422 length:174 start_codon:yes stop_codon:yes gene_type:complete